MKNFTVNKSRYFTQKNDELNQLFRFACRHKVLTKEAEYTATPEQLVNHNILFVISVAKNYRYKTVDFMDIVSEGLIGLIKAARQFDSSAGFRFTSYSVAPIRAHIIRYIESKQDMIRQPDKAIQYSNKIKKNQNSDESVFDTAKRLGITDNYVKLHLNKPEIFYIDSLNDDGETYFELAGDHVTDTNIVASQTKTAILRSVNKLNDIEQKIIKLRYLGDYEMTFEGISEQLGLCRERVRQIEKVALTKLRKTLSPANV